MFAGFITAVRTLSVLPCPGKDADDRSASLPWFPVVGLLLGLILYGIAYAYERLAGNVWPEGLGILLLVAGVVLTRGLHLDGLADWADGFWGARDRERVLAIMKDSAIGAFGSIALVLICLAKWVCLTRIAASGGILWIVTAYVVSRTVMVGIAVALPYARDEGGTGKELVDGARSSQLLVSVLVSAIIVFVLCGREGLVVLSCGLVAGRVLQWWYCRRVGGVTGDLLGAASEGIETLGLMMGALLAYV